MNLAYCAKVLVTFEFVLKVLNKNLFGLYQPLPLKQHLFFS